VPLPVVREDLRIRIRSGENVSSKCDNRDKERAMNGQKLSACQFLAFAAAIDVSWYLTLEITVERGKESEQKEDCEGASYKRTRIATTEQ
jgi:hypothetical protein